MRKKIRGIVALLLVISFLAGCTKCIDVQTSEVEVTITDVYHHGSYTTMQYNAAIKVMMPHIHPAVYRVTVSYNGADYYFYDSATYERCKNSLGEQIPAVLETRLYNNGTERYNIVSIK